jgi:hypothetical protein
MTIEDIRTQINNYEKRILRLEEEFSKKEISTKREINAKYRSQFEEILTDFRIKMEKVEEINNKSQKFLTKRKEEKDALKFLKREITAISKRKKNELKENLEFINREKRIRIEKINKQIKNLKKKKKELEATKFAERWKKWRHL